jgi:hypothetical protein
MCTVRYVGLFLEDPLAVPWPVVEHLAAQLGIEDPSVLKRYAERRQTLYDHAWEIRDAYGYHPYDDPEWERKFIAVGTALAGGPPHRSQRALLTHWAPALGANAKARVGKGVHHPGGR